jgi:hypothetical protein
VIYAGKSWFGAHAWSSAVKRGQTIGLLNYFPATDGPVKLVEDGQRVGRWLLGQGIFGGFKADTLRVGIYKPGRQTKAGPVEDGFGYIKKSLVDQFARKERIELGTSRDNWTFWQRLNWQDIRDEMIPLINKSLENVSDPAKKLVDAPHSYDQKKSLYDANKGIIEHPFVAAALNRTAQLYFARLCSSVNLNGNYRTAVPTSAETICWPGHSGNIIQAVHVAANAAEENRILSMEVAQITIATRDFMTKGCVGIVPDELMGEYDILVCSEDIKMASAGVDKLRKEPYVDLENVVVPFIQIWSSKSLVGVNAKWAKNKMGLDHDGDAVRLVDCNELPCLWNSIRNLPEGETPKLPKSKRLLSEGDLRSEMIYKSMVNLVVQATNVSGSTFMVADRTLLAAQLGHTSVSALDARLNFFVKVVTDGFMTDVDQAAVAKEIAILQTNMSKMFGVSAPCESNKISYLTGILAERQSKPSLAWLPLATAASSSHLHLTATF